ncbi:MAG TPA: hypothetical protein PLD12_00255 [Bacteroidales bacterium]|nr:hypothetical protein [Bacteroidales bacterium]HPO64368.1 hypothetical protein [Bacteroidales bacterium]
MWLCVMFINNPITAQDYEWLVEKAKELYNQGLFDEATITCERYLYFSDNPQLKHSALFIEAKAFQQKGNYSYSSNILLSIPRINLEKHTKSLIDFNLALNSYMDGFYDEAQVYLDNCDTTVMDDTERRNYELLKLLNLCYTERWQEASALVKNSSFFSDTLKNELITLLNKPPKLLNAKKLEWLSRFIPGSGQIMAGYWVEGVSSFLLCSGSLTLGIFLFINRYYISGYSLGGGLLYAFYYGGLRRLNEITQAENQNRKNLFIVAIKEKLKN